MKLRWYSLALCAMALVGFGKQTPDDLDRLIQTQMVRRQTVGVSLAIIHAGRIIEARAYGTTARNAKIRVTPQTLFQAGSVSKPVSAMGVLRLVDTGKLSLDEDVNTKLKSWRVPDNDLTRTEHVTLRRLLSHTAGLGVPGFPGYERSERIPSILEVLDGRGNTPPVRVEVTPGTDSRYSGGGYVVMQQLIEDVTGKAFPKYMADEILTPLGMTRSTYEQPLPPALARQAVAGYLPDRSGISGGWHVFPEMAPAGLWTTATDLAKYVIGVQQAFGGKSRVLSADLTRQMLTVQRAGMALGPSVDRKGNHVWFMHNGRTRGFDTILIADAGPSGDGLVVMISGNDNSLFGQGNCCQNRIVNFIAKKYSWTDYDFPPPPETVVPASVSPTLLSDLTGSYEYQDTAPMVLGAENNRVYTYVDGLPDEEFVPASDGRFVSTEHALSFTVSRNAKGEVDGIVWKYSTDKPRRLPRIGRR